MDTQTVQMDLQPKTIDLIEKLTTQTGATSSAQLIVSSLELTNELIKTVQGGAKIYIENKDGTKQLLSISGSIKL